MENIAPPISVQLHSIVSASVFSILLSPVSRINCIVVKGVPTEMESYRKGQCTVNS